jgi:adenylate cyclase
MEQDVAILIADLSGYTALTETHGSLTAADLIDKYIDIVNASLIGSSMLQERVGDEVMIISESADNLLATAEVLLQTTQEEYNFLEVHGGLHFGKLLKRNNSYFGSALNLTARIASEACAGCFLCSQEFLRAINDKSLYRFKSKGKFSFKNVSDDKEIFEITLEKPAHIYIDPVCRMIVNKEKSHVFHPTQSGVLFCSQNCLDVYLSKEISGNKALA